MSDEDPSSLVLTETGIARHEDGAEAVNVGPIIAALAYLTEGRGNDRGLDQDGAPLPDLLSLAFDVLKSIILGGKEADYFRRVKQSFDSGEGFDGRTSLSLAKEASAVLQNPATAALRKASLELRARATRLDEATLHWLAELSTLQALGKTVAKPKRRKSRAKPQPQPQPQPKTKAKPKPKAAPRAARTPQARTARPAQTLKARKKPSKTARKTKRRR